MLYPGLAEELARRLVEELARSLADERDWSLVEERAWSILYDWDGGHLGGRESWDRRYL